MLINNLDADHLDYYKDLADVQSAFRELALRVPKDGAVVCDLRNANVLPAIKDITAPVYDYNEEDISDVKLPLPGEHNRQNAKAALCISKLLGLDEKESKKALADFRGTWRRFEYKGKTANGALVYDDYAHNPQKVAAAIAGAREMYPEQKIIAVFQPHLFSRTKLLLNEFSKSFVSADEVLLLPIYPAREAFDPTITSEMLAGKIKSTSPAIGMAPSPHLMRGSESNPFPLVKGRVGERLSEVKKVSLIKNFTEVENYLKTNSNLGDVILVIGAGDVYKIAEKVIA